MRTPRQKFFESAFRKPYEDIVNRVEYEEALNAALLELQVEMLEPTDPSKSWDQGSRLAGARRFVQILSSLHLRDEPPKVQKLTQLRPPQ
jgi:hypothetical protein